LSDPRLEVISAYNLFMKKEYVAEPATFIVNQQGTTNIPFSEIRDRI